MRSLKQLFATGTRRIVVAAIVLIALGIAILAMTREDHGAALMMPLLYSILAVGILWLAIYFGTKAWRKRKRKEFDEGVAAKEGIEDRRREWGTWVEELEGRAGVPPCDDHRWWGRSTRRPGNRNG